MNSGMKIVSIALLLLAGTGSAFAGPWARMREARPMQQQPQQRQQMQGDPRRGQPVFATPNANTPIPSFPGAYGEPGRPGNVNRPGNQVRMFGPRMSVEERQKIRRRINEAGQDIYSPKK